MFQYLTMLNKIHGFRHWNPFSRFHSFPSTYRYIVVHLSCTNISDPGTFCVLCGSGVTAGIFKLPEIFYPRRGACPAAAGRIKNAR